MKRILMVLDSTYPEDIRVSKEIRALERGFKIGLVCSKDSKVDIPSTPEIELIKVGPRVNKYNKTLRDIFLGLFFFDPWMWFTMKKAIKAFNPDIIHVHDLPQFKTCWLAKTDSIKIVLDLHENYPEAIKTWFIWRKSLFIKLKNLILFNPTRWKRFEKFACKHTDYILAVVEEMATRIQIDHFIVDKKIFVITNTEEKKFLEAIKTSQKSNCTQLFDRKCYNLLYIGGIGPHRGIDDAILGVAELVNSELSIKPTLHIIGGGNKDNINYLKSLSIRLGISEFVKFHGKVPFDCVPYYMSNCELNIIPHKSNGHCDNTVPHKLFQAMMSNIPVLVSSSSPLQRIIIEHKSGFVFQANSPSSFAEKVRAIMSDPEGAKTASKNAFKATINGTLNWETTGESLRKFYLEVD